jgi:hypothetical protein
MTPAVPVPAARAGAGPGDTGPDAGRRTFDGYDSSTRHNGTKTTTCEEEHVNTGSVRV